jgi:hypothetical protein
LPVHEALERAVADVEAFAHGAHEGVQNNPRGQFAELGPALLREGLETADIFRRALPLLVSSLYYLSDPPKSDPVPASDTPEPLARKVREAGTPNARRKALSSLFGHGYAMVRLCGQEFQTEANATRGMSTKCHWRRGHFRDQRHGEGLALVKRLWIHPTLVSSDAGAPAEGHIYRADQLPPASPD